MTDNLFISAARAVTSKSLLDLGIVDFYYYYRVPFNRRKVFGHWKVLNLTDINHGYLIFFIDLEHFLTDYALKTSFSKVYHFKNINEFIPIYKYP